MYLQMPPAVRYGLRSAGGRFVARGAGVPDERVAEGEVQGAPVQGAPEVPRRRRRIRAARRSSSESSGSRSRSRSRPARGSRRRSPSPRERRRRRSPRPRRRRSPSQERMRSASPRRRRRIVSTSSSSSSSSDDASAARTQLKINERLLERLEKLEKYEEKTRKKEKVKFKWTKTGCEKQHDFNEEVKEVYSEKLRSELRWHFQGELPNKVEEIIKEGEKLIDDQNQKLKIADEFGFRALDEFVKEDLARNEKEEKKIKKLRKEKKEKEDKSKATRTRTYRSFRDRRFGDRNRK